ncbi:hypothetical protein EMIT0P253_20132 [Pseudomonas sp. IT-P253]
MLTCAPTCGTPFPAATPCLASTVTVYTSADKIRNIDSNQLLETVSNVGIRVCWQADSVLPKVSRTRTFRLFSYKQPLREPPQINNLQPLK